MLGPGGTGSPSFDTFLLFSVTYEALAIIPREAAHENIPFCDFSLSLFLRVSLIHPNCLYRLRKREEGAHKVKEKKWKKRKEYT
jgi:hypothetical protein